MRLSRPNHVVGLLVVVLVGLALLGSCGSDDGGTDPLDVATLESQGCNDWNDASPQERTALVTDLGYTATPEVTRLIVAGVDNFCTGPDADPELGLGGAIRGTALAIGAEPIP